MNPPRFSIRLKLTIGALLPLFVAILFSFLTGVYIINSRIADQAQEKVRTDLNTARELYLTEISHVRDVVRFTAGTPQAAAILAGIGQGPAHNYLTGLLGVEQLDILTVVDHSGRVVYRARAPHTAGDHRGDDLLVIRALKGDVVAGTELFLTGVLAREGSDLARRAKIPVVPTPHARQDAKQFENSGMLLVAAAPVRDGKGAVVGALYGGVLLNGNNTLVDKIKRVVYEEVRFQGEDVGTATIFLDDVRITTNVLAKNGDRAIGTRLSAEVYDRVIMSGEKWVDRAFVVKDWYFSAYEPISDLSGRVIGSLYVGLLEKPYGAIRSEVYLLFGGVLLVGTLIGLAVSGFIGSHFSRPIRELQSYVQRFSAGERQLRIEVTTGDEIGDLGAEFNDMTRTLAGHEEEIRTLNRELEEKVRERTAELEEKNQLLLKTREELVRVEKLAAVGELAAGVAHEINNPMAIIRGNAELLQMAIGRENPCREEVDTISRQVGRVERIVAGLLRFARQERQHTGQVALAPLLEEILGQIGHQAPLGGIVITRKYEPALSGIAGDADQLRQVFTNLILNAVQAMPGGGELTIATCRGETPDSCRITIGDTGCGIPPEHLEQVFNPFFTTRSAGTGLGLSVSYGIVRDHGGRIDVQSELGHGATFTVTLPRGEPGGRSNISDRQ